MEKPRTLEDEYFFREDAERLRRLHKEEMKRLEQSEREALRKLHGGRCANCGALMVPERIHGVPILHCPACGGTFLYRESWEHIQEHVEPHSVMAAVTAAVLNLFKPAVKP